jgi:hypothetical protein
MQAALLMMQLPGALDTAVSREVLSIPVVLNIVLQARNVVLNL